FFAACTLANVPVALATAAQSGPAALSAAAACRAMTSGAWMPTWALMALPATVRIAAMEPRVPWANVMQPLSVVTGTGAGIDPHAPAGFAMACWLRSSSAAPPPHVDGGLTLPRRSVVARRL